MTCHACGAQLSPSAQFCHKCGAATATTRAAAAGWRAGLPWALAGAAFGALVAVVLMRGGGSKEQGAESAAFSPAGGGPAAIDLSQMSPEERANRLFDRVMILAQAGKSDSVGFFLPMALSSYDMLPTKNADARYHIGLLQLAGGDPAAALAQADSIQKQIPTHLFVSVLRAHAYQGQGNARAERQAYLDFLKNEPAEMARNREEYGDHQAALTAFKAEAARVASRPRS